MFAQTNRDWESIVVTLKHVATFVAVVALPGLVLSTRPLTKTAAPDPERLATLVDGAAVGPYVDYPPISVTASVDHAKCDGSPVSVTAVVTDAYGMPLADAVVTGVLQQTATWTNFAFPLTDDSGSATTAMNAGRPRGGGAAVFSVHATAGGYTADGAASCTAP
jgi:hypothetical protein